MTNPQAELDQLQAEINDIEARVPSAPVEERVALAQQLDRAQKLAGQLQTAMPFIGINDDDLAEQVLDLKEAMEIAAEKAKEFPSGSARAVKAKREHEAARLRWANAETEVRRRDKFVSFTTFALRGAASKARTVVDDAGRRFFASVADDIRNGRQEAWRLDEAKSLWESKKPDMLATETRKAFKQFVTGHVPESLLQEP